MRGAATAAVWLALLFAPGWATAHPLDEVVQGAYLTLSPGQVRLQLDLTPGTEVAGAVLRSLDSNGDQRITDAEARTYAFDVLRQSTLTLDGVAVAWTLENVSAPSYQSLKAAGDALKIYAVAKRSDKTGAHTLVYENRYQPAKSQCIANVFVQPGAGWRYQITGQEHGAGGRRLSVTFSQRAFSG